MLPMQQGGGAEMTSFVPDGQSAPPRYHRDVVDVLEKNLILARLMRDGVGFRLVTH
jgi:hypothetical protein